MAISQDEDIRIKDIPNEAETIVQGMFVAVDSEANDTEKFDLNRISQSIDTVDGKVDAVRQVPVSEAVNAGQVLTVNNAGTAGWADAPKELPGTIGTEGQVLTIQSGNVAWANVPSELPGTLGTAGQVLTVVNNAVGWADAPKELPGTIGTEGQVLTVQLGNVTWANAPGGLPGTLGTAGQVLTVVNNAVSWADVPKELPTEGSTGQVLTKTSTGASWQNAAGGSYTMTTISTYQRSNWWNYYGTSAYAGFPHQLSLRNNALFSINYSEILADAGLILRVGYGNTDSLPNMLVEMTPTTDITLTVKDYSGTVLKYSKAAGNVLTAGKYYQITVLGNCWTMAEFESPS